MRCTDRGSVVTAEWAVIGGVVVVVGLALPAWAWRIRRSRLTRPSDAFDPSLETSTPVRGQSFGCVSAEDDRLVGPSLLYRVCVRVEVWSDVVCPWCYVGKRRLESALERFGRGDIGTNPEDAPVSPSGGHAEVAVAARVYGVRSARSTARATSTRDATPSLRKVLRRWVSTVFELRKSSAAI